MSLTPYQVEILKVLKAVQPTALTGPQLIESIPDRKPAEIHQTATGLSRRGLVLKAWTGSIHRTVSYSIAPPGEQALKQHYLGDGTRIKRGST